MASQCEEINTIITQFMTTAQLSLSQIITSFQSDQLLQQMRNDQNLYNEKLNYIHELIKQHFSFEPINPQLIREITQLKISKTQLEARLEDSKDEYISELINIQVHYKQFLLEKENQKKQMERTVENKNQQIFILNKNYSHKIKDLQTQLLTFQKELQILKNQQNQLRIYNDQFERTNQKLIKQLQLLKNGQKQDNQQKNIQASSLSLKIKKLQKQNNELLGQSRELKDELKIMQEKIILLTESEQQYSDTIQKMKQDMFLIKQEWEKRCLQIESDLSEDYRKRLIQHEEEMNEKLKLYMEELKMGKSIIIQSSEEILASKKAHMQHHFDEQLQKYNQELSQYQQELALKQVYINQLQTQIKLSQQALSLRETQTQQLKTKLELSLKNSDNLLIKKDQQLTNKLKNYKMQSEKQIQRLRKTQNMFLKDLKTSKLQKQELQKEVHAIREQFNILKQKQLQQSRKFKQMEQSYEASTTKILQLKKNLAILNEKNTMDEKSLKDKNNQIFRLQSNLNQLKVEYKELDTVIRKLQLKLSDYNLRHKQNQKMKGERIHKIQKLFILVRKLTKQLSLIKQDIQFEVNVQKSKFQTMILALNQQVNLRVQNIKYNHKIKIKELLEDVQIQKKDERQEMQQVLRENQNMKKQMKLIEQIMRQKQEDNHYDRERTINLEVEKCRLLMQEDIVRERDERRKLQEKLYNQQKKYDYMITKAQKEVLKNIKLFMSKWEAKLSHTQDLLQYKQKHLKQTTHHLKKAISQIESLKSDMHEKDDKLSRQQKKYESLKQERDRTIDEMMKRLEKQTRHKIALERQMKQVRGEIIKTQTNTNNSPFNNYSFTDRQNATVYTNAFQATTHEKTKTQVKGTHREKELFEIRQMIAKTYKVMEGPEKDSPLHKGKLF